MTGLTATDKRTFVEILIMLAYLAVHVSADKGIYDIYMIRAGNQIWVILWYFFFKKLFGFWGFIFEFLKFLNMAFLIFFNSDYSLFSDLF